MKYKDGIIEKMSADEASSFYPPKKYHVTLPEGKTDGHGATVVYVTSVKAAKQAINCAS